MALYIFRLPNIQWLFLTTSLWGKHSVAVTILHVGRGREVCNQFCTIKLMKLNSLKHEEALSDLNENRTVGQSWSAIVFHSSQMQCSGSNFVASHIPLQKSTFVKQLTRAELLQSEICSRNRKNALQFSLHLNKNWDKFACPAKWNSFNFSPLWHRRQHFTLQVWISVCLN